MQWNLQSYKSKFSELKQILNQYTPICMCLQETMINNNHNRQFPPSHYEIVHSTRVRQDGHERGAAILIHKKVQYETIQLQTTLQAVAITLFLDRKYTLCSLYLPHHPVSQIEIDNLINQLHHPLIVMGDFNAKSPIWGGRQVDTDHRGRIIENILHSLPLSVLNNASPTHYHIQTDTYSTIDLSICSSQCYDDLEFEVLQSRFTSDHYPTKIKFKEPPVIINSTPRFKIEKADWATFQRSTETDFEPGQNDDVNRVLEAITDRIILAAGASIPKTNGNLQRPPVPWWNAECKQARREYCRAERALHRQYSIANKIRFNRAKANKILTMNRRRKESFQSYIQSINQNISLHQVWKRVRKIEGRFSPTPLPILEDNAGRVFSDPKETSNKLADHFASVSHINNYNRQFRSTKNQKEQQEINFTSRHDMAYNSPISEIELTNALSSSQESSPGEDQVTYSMIKHSHPSLKRIILLLYNKVFSEQTFPSRWRTAIVIPIPKPNKDHKKTENYRPISLTSTLCKLMEKIINARLMWILESEGHINQIQSGFRKNRSTTDHIVQLETHIREAQNNRLHTIAIFFDLQKAYDTAWRYGLLKVLHSFGLRGLLPVFIKNFLSDRTLKVRVGSALSDPVNIQEGVPQGSVLSCTLFLVAINSIACTVPPTVSSMLYVDDFTIYASGATTRSIERRLQLVLNSLQEWSNQTGFQFSPSKTVSIHICRKHHCPKMAPNLTLYGAPINCTNTVRFLGVTFDNSLTWKPHINNLKNKCHKTLNLFKKLSNTKWGSDSPTLIKLFIMLLKPAIEYGVEAFASAADTYMNSLNTIQNSAIRIATGAYRTSPIVSLHALTALPPQKYAYHNKQLNYYLRLVVNPSHPFHDCVIDQDDLDEEAIIERTPPKSFLARAHSLHLQYHLDTSRILIEKCSTYPPWKIECLHACKDLFDIKKASTPQLTFKRIFEDHVMQHNHSFPIFTDGSKDDHGVGYAYTCATNSHQCRLPIQSTIYSAELFAIRDAIIYAENELPNESDITLHTDSKSSIQAISSPLAKNPIIQFIQDLIISSNKNYILCWVPSHVGIPGNEHADHLARSSILLPITPMSLPRSDYKGHMKREIRKSWHNSWRTTLNNKLREFNPTIPTKYIDKEPRSWSVKLSRLKIGHTRLTHEHLISGNPQPYCDDCLVPLTVRHFLVECPSHIQHRGLFGCPGPPTLADVFGHGNCAADGPLEQYTRLIGIYDDI